MKKIKLFSFLMLFLGCFQQANAETNDKIVCEAKHTLHHGKFVISSNYKFIMADNAGVILINGTSHLGPEQYVISREIHFIYKKQGSNSYLFTSDRIYKNPIDTMPDPVAAKHYPTFFMEKDNNLIFFIKPVNKTDYIISFISTPLFYCNG